MLVTQKTNKEFLYLDKNKNLHLDKNSLYERVIRVFLSFLGLRNYDLTSIITVAEKKPLKDRLNHCHGYSVEDLTERLARKAHLSAFEYQNVCLLNNFYNASGKKRFSKIEKKSISEFIEKGFANKNLNKKLENFYKRLPESLRKSHEKSLITMLSYSYKTRNVSLFTKAYKKLSKIDPLISKKGIKNDLSKNEKLTLQEVFNIEKTASLASIFKDFNSMKIRLPSKIKEPSEKVIQSAKFIDKIQTIAEKQSPHKKSGSLIFYDIKNFKARRAKITSFFEFLTFKKIFGTDFFHSSLGYLDAKKKNIEVDIWGFFRKSRRTLFSYTFKTLEFNVDQIAPDQKTREKLIRLYGKKWQNVIETKYQKILQKCFSDPKKFSHLKNPALKRIMVGIGLKWHPLRYSVEERIKFVNRYAVCSEFVIKILMQCFFTLQDEVNTEWKGKVKNEDSPTLFHPIQSNIRLHRIKPHEIIKSLFKNGFVKETPYIPIVDQIIDYKHYKLSK